MSVTRSSSEISTEYQRQTTTKSRSELRREKFVVQNSENAMILWSHL